MRILATYQLNNFLIYSDIMTNYNFIKRSLDIVLSILGIIITSPLCLVIYLLIKREDGGPVIFRQERIGYGGKPFTIYKFRSMIIEAEKDDKPVLCQRNDKRMTKVGYFLREHHLDEIPQLWNILKGDMSLVGPRPERKFFVDRIISVNPDYKLLYKLRPGIFSPATLYNGYTDTMEKMLERLRMDLEYMRNKSFWLDVKIIYLTLTSLLTGKKF
ncbi:sugar transferase [Bacteroides caecigallinarum]|uniref:sugar transferase n=1 Tax=Bacteroides caecigallinarum TaxID=1411144 RepID=UPI00195D397B|nr:sugar transferase [Bacteroides caecigallinarum]